MVFLVIALYTFIRPSSFGGVNMGQKKVQRTIAQKPKLVDTGLAWAGCAVMLAVPATELADPGMMAQEFVSETEAMFKRAQELTFTDIFDIAVSMQMEMEN